MIFGSFSLFLIFYLLFKLNFFYLKITKKGSVYLQMLTWQARKPASRHVARGTTVQMRRGFEATWQGRGWPTRGAGGARRGHVAKSHATTRVHVGARVGRHMARGFAYGGPTGKVGPGKKLGAVTQMRYRAPIFKRAAFNNFSRVALCPTRLIFCR